MVSFENTEIAFKSKTNIELEKAWWLFRFIGNNQLVRLTKPFAGIAVKIGFPFRYMIKQTIFQFFNITAFPFQYMGDNLWIGF